MTRKSIATTLVASALSSALLVGVAAPAVAFAQEMPEPAIVAQAERIDPTHAVQVALDFYGVSFNNLDYVDWGEAELGGVLCYEVTFNERSRWDEGLQGWTNPCGYHVFVVAENGEVCESYTF